MEVWLCSLKRCLSFRAPAEVTQETGSAAWNWLQNWPMADLGGSKQLRENKIGSKFIMLKLDVRFRGILLFTFDCI